MDQRQAHRIADAFRSTCYREFMRFEDSRTDNGSYGTREKGTAVTKMESMREHRQSPRRPGRLALVVGGLVVAAALGTVHGTAGPGSSTISTPEPPFPLDEHLTYDVLYLGIRCGSLTLTSFADEGVEDTLYHIVATARTSKFFDGIYRVRVRLESVYSGRRMSSVSYHHTGKEKNETKDELWLVDYDKREVQRNRDGEIKTIAIESDQVYDPLAYLYRMRALLSDSSRQATLAMVTSDGDVETVAEVREKRTVKTPFGKREALIVVPRPKDDELFDKKGSMELWVGTDDRRLLYRVVFDLPFGKLVARLDAIEERVVSDESS
jgi:hypothetical protein